MYIRGDLIPGVGIVDVNHCGMPWPVALDGSVFYGCVQVGNLREGYPRMCDARSGKILTPEEFEGRRNKILYDYESKWEDCEGWRKRNTERMLRGEVKDVYRKHSKIVQEIIIILLKLKVRIDALRSRKR